MNTREKFKKQGVALNWGKKKVVLEVGRAKDKIVCSPAAFRWLRKAIDALNDIGYVDPLMEGEMLDAQVRETKPRKGRRDGAVRASEVQPDEYLEGILSRIRSESDALGILDHGETFPLYKGRREDFILCSADQAPLVQQLLDSHPQYDEAGYLVLPHSEG